MTAPKNHPKAVEVFAKSVFRELKGHGYSRDDIVAFASAMLGLLADDVRATATAESAESAA